MKSPGSNRTVFFYLAIVVLLWGLNSVSIKYLTQFYPPLALAPIRLFLASAFLLAFVSRQYGFQKVPRSAWPAIAGVACFCIFLHQITLTIGIKATSSTHAVLILGTNPLFTTLFAALFFNEAFTRAKGLGILLGFSGLLFVVTGGGQGESSISGDIIVAIATITFVIGSFFVKKATAIVSPLIITAYSHVLGFAGLFLLGIFVNPVWSFPGNLDFWPLAVLLFSSFMSTAVGALLWNRSIQQVGASTASLFQNATPVIGVFASAAFLGERLTWQHPLALTLVVLGVSLGTGIMKLPDFIKDKKQES